MYGDCKEVAAYEDTSVSLNTTPQKLVREKSHFCSHDHYYRILKTGMTMQSYTLVFATGEGVIIVCPAG